MKYLYCQTCTSAKARPGADTPEFDSWFEGHFNEGNVKYRHGFRYTTVLSDGEAKTFKRLSEMEVYGPDVKIEKEECVNHVACTPRRRRRPRGRCATRRSSPPSGGRTRKTVRSVSRFTCPTRSTRPFVHNAPPPAERRRVPRRTRVRAAKIRQPSDERREETETRESAPCAGNQPLPTYICRACRLYDDTPEKLAK